ncbi:hypothetical protein LP416_08520 [Polaromonas sp. P2-4]|nr:hypothetical protein LP416_08520 [Polaromonas sp. P2-4]
MKRALTAIFSVAAMVLFMTGCSGMRLVDNDVTAFPRWNGTPPGPGTAYRFERLPSQQAPEMQQDRVEAQARTALAKVGMELNPAAALQRAGGACQPVAGPPALRKWTA